MGNVAYILQIFWFILESSKLFVVVMTGGSGHEIMLHLQLKFQWTDSYVESQLKGYVLIISAKLLWLSDIQRA